MAKTKTVDDLLAERDNAALDVIELEAKAQQLHRAMIDHEDNLVVRDPKVIHLLQKRHGETLGAMTDKLTLARQKVRQLDAQLAHVLQEQANADNADKRRELKAIRSRMRVLCDQLDRDFYRGWDQWRQLEELYRAQQAIFTGLLRAGASTDCDPLITPQAALKLVFMAIEQRAFHNAQREGQSWGKWNPARATLREAMRLD